MKNSFFIFLILVSFVVRGQRQTPESLLNGNRKAKILDKSNIKGAYFVYGKWNVGELVLNDSVISNQDYLRYDAYENKIFIKKREDVIEINDNSLVGFSIIERKKNIKHDFVKLQKKDFKNNGEVWFYEIVFNDQNSNYVLKKNVKIVYDPNINKSTQFINDEPLEFKDKSKYFIMNNKGLYVLVRLNKKEIKAILTNHAKLVDSFIKKNRIKFRREEDVVKLVNYYYSL